MNLAAIFVHPMTITSDGRLWLILPLCIAVAIVYKAIRTDSVRKLPGQCMALIVYMFGGLVLLAAALWAVWQFLP
jgi:hypothetical protein